MLILTRELGEQIRIGDEVIVRILGMHGTQVRVAIDAPQSVRLLRSELLEREQLGERTPGAEGAGVGVRVP